MENAERGENLLKDVKRMIALLVDSMKKNLLKKLKKMKRKGDWKKKNDCGRWKGALLLNQTKMVKVRFYSFSVVNVVAFSCSF
jgi:hypothetical protein